MLALLKVFLDLKATIGGFTILIRTNRDKGIIPMAGDPRYETESEKPKEERESSP